MKKEVNARHNAGHAAEISGIVALMLQRNDSLTPMRHVLQSTAKDVGPKGPEIMFGTGLADAYAAIQAEPAPAPRPTGRALTRSAAPTCGGRVK